MGFTFGQLNESIVSVLKELHITEPTDIQKKMIPEALDGQSIIARSQTGTGKTLAYLLPALNKIDEQVQRLQVLILTPTQELAMQVVDVAKKITENDPVHIGAFIGGANINRQVEKLKKQKPQLAVGTPGRLLELIQMKKLKLADLQVVVVDEADRMMGEQSSWGATMEIAKRAGRDIQYLCVSATIPDGITEQMRQVAPFIVELEAAGGLVEAEKVNHCILRVEQRDKVDVTRKLVYAESIKRGIVFVNQLEKLHEVAEKLVYKGLRVQALSSDHSKQEREKAMKQLRNGDTDLLVATDIAARGLDIDDVTHIIQFDVAATSDQYVHRSGRTGRMGKTGTVITLLDRRDEYKIEKYQKELKIDFSEVVLTHGHLTKK
ncbi:DEAD/DEAH box helicase [Halalkalibacter hemicellulosilyticus]|uniref:ATP-dependent RNA helicase YfmL n=1 Tax=Halalkalibacter hemicellulosilyticusJCM 9152 TaxID=1236971 RepID=W4QFB1_9BACI|nr:DEAD/DEAH box helicase [Halalkalibacter hemicellulosilyticus]GAE30338.1 ATP-dependent RNA helicase YfmL [Halalkalibacter hemicellulosilyticusJCM 9152]